MPPWWPICLKSPRRSFVRKCTARLAMAKKSTNLCGSGNDEKLARRIRINRWSGDFKTDDATIDMKPQAHPSAQEVLAGLVERVTYHNAENGFCVLRAKARGHRDVVT